MTGITRALARFVVNSKYDALPPAIRHEGARAFVNWVGCAADGSQEDAIEHAPAAERIVAACWKVEQYPPVAPLCGTLGVTA